MMRDETVAATNVQNVRPEGNHARDLQSHVIRATNLAPAPLALEAASDSIYEGACCFYARC